MNFKVKRWVNEGLYSDAMTWDGLDTCLRFAPADLERLNSRKPAFSH
jgi:hypothetical protein